MTEMGLTFGDNGKRRNTFKNLQENVQARNFQEGQDVDKTELEWSLSKWGYKCLVLGTGLSQSPLKCGI